MDENLVVNNQSIEVDEPSNSPIAPSSDSVSVESCSFNKDNTTIVMMDDIVVTEGVQYFSSRPALVIDEDDTEFPSNNPSPTSIHVTCPPIIDHQSLTHSLIQAFSMTTRNSICSILLLTIRIPLYQVIVSTRCVTDVGEKVHSYYSNIIWSRAGKYVVETTFANEASKPSFCLC